MKFDLVTLKSNQFISSARYIHCTCSEFDSSPSVSIDNASTSHFCINMSPMIFDLMTPPPPPSNQFIDSVRYLHDPSLALIHRFLR